MFGLGRIHLEIGDRIGAMSFGGIGVMRRLVSRLGSVREIDRRLPLLKRHLPYCESDPVPKHRVRRSVRERTALRISTVCATTCLARMRWGRR